MDCYTASNNERKDKLTKGQTIVYKTLKQYGKASGLPDHVLVPMVQHVSDLSSSGVRSRRKELVEKGLVIEKATPVVMPSGRSAAVWKVRK